MKRLAIALLALSTLPACTVEFGIGLGSSQSLGPQDLGFTAGDCQQHAFTPERPLDLEITNLRCIDDWGDGLVLDGWLAVQPLVPVGQQTADLWQCGNDVALEYDAFGPMVEDCAAQLYDLGCQWGSVDSANTALELCYRLVDTEISSGLPPMQHDVVLSNQCGQFAPLTGCI